MTYRVLVGRRKGKSPLVGLKLLTLIFNKQDARERTGLIWLRLGTCWAVVNAAMNCRFP